MTLPSKPIIKFVYEEKWGFKDFTCYLNAVKILFCFLSCQWVCYAKDNIYEQLHEK